VAPEVDVARVALQTVLVISGLFLVLLILMHKGKGGGLSDMFGGGVSSNLGGSSMAERNLNRITIGAGLVWTATILGLGLLDRIAAG
jgi:preprotein translocase subunit SecG